MRVQCCGVDMLHRDADSSCQNRFHARTSCTKPSHRDALVCITRPCACIIDLATDAESSDHVPFQSPLGFKHSNTVFRARSALRNSYRWPCRYRGRSWRNRCISGRAQPVRIGCRRRQACTGELGRTTGVQQAAAGSGLIISQPSAHVSVPGRVPAMHKAALVE